MTMQDAMSYLKKNAMLLQATVVASLVFACWSLYPLLNGMFDYPGLVTSPSSVFQSTYSWMPLIRSVANGVLFPSIPSITPDTQSMHFYPYITLWFNGLLQFLLGYKGTIFVGQWLLPTLNFYLLGIIFQRYLSPLWSIALTSLALISFSDWPFRDFLLGLIHGQGWMQLGVSQPLEIVHFPIPSFSTFAFLILFYFSTDSTKLTNQRLFSMTFMWALMTQVHIVDAIFGLAFWFTYTLIRLVRQKETLFAIIMKLVAQLTLVAIVASPVLYAYLKSNISGVSYGADLGLFSAGVNAHVGLYYCIAYFIVPLTLMFFIYQIQRVDIYEILFKFWYVYVLMILEALLLAISVFSPFGIHLSVVQNRIAFFFLHFYYYVPVIYFASRANHTYYSGTESGRIAASLRNLLNKFFTQYSRIYLPVFILLLIVFAGTSAFNFIHFQKSTATPELLTSWNELTQLQNSIPDNNVIVSETPAVNLLATISRNSATTSLWINRFANDVSINETIDRLALYARIYDWSEDKFIQFMLPGELQKKRSNIVSLDINELNASGVGYWLVFHERPLVEANKTAYIQMLSKHYRDLDIKHALKTYNIKSIYAYQTIDAAIPVKNKIKLAQGYLYEIE